MSTVQRTESDQAGWRALPATIASRLFLDRQLEFWLREFGSIGSLAEIRARVLDVIAETEYAKTFVLQPNARWSGHLAGQYTTIEAQIDGVRVRRCYSISSAPSSRLLSITVKRLPDGRVSSWLHDNVKPGGVLTLQPPAGEFVLPEALPDKLLMLSGGSGITPVMSMVRDLDRRRAIRDLVFVHCARSRDETIFASALEEIAERIPGFRLVLFLSDDRIGVGRFDEEKLLGLVPDFADRYTFLCGPTALMERAERLWAEKGIVARVRRERFVAAGVSNTGSVAAGTGEIKLVRSGQTVLAGSPGTLLEQLERGGAKPAYGCRMGICQTCKCRKKSGTVENLVTGAVSSEPDEDIQLCITLARSDLELAL
jgi:stearoyl-CoA 9-desaturase NADPH oxidoreductase